MSEQTFTPTATEVQPDQGQGQPTADPSAVQPSGQGQQGVSDLYQEALAAVPEDQRPLVEPHFKEWDRRVNPKLEEFAKYRERWQGFDEIEELHQAGPEGVRALLSFAEALQGDDPKQVLLDLAANMGIDLGAAQAPEQAAPESDPVAELRAELQAMKDAQAAEEIGRRFRAEVETIKAEHKQAFLADMTEEEEQRLIQLGARFASDHEEPYRAAYELMKSIAGSAQNQLVTQAPTPPAPGMPAGRASTTTEPVDNFDDAERIWRERSAAARTH